MHANSDALRSEANSHPASMLYTEDEFMEHGSPESDLWNSVLLQLLKEAQYIRKDLESTQRILNKKSASAARKDTAFHSHYRAQMKRQSMGVYLRSTDFSVVVDYAGHNIDCIKPKILEILEGTFSVTDNQVKRSFTRKPDKKGKS